MSMLVHKPPPPLAPYVECFWRVNLRAPYRREKILPTGTAELIINFGAPFRLYDRDVPARFTCCAESWLVGLHTAYLLNEPIAETNMIGVRFKPGGLYAFLRVPAAELHNQVVPLDVLWGVAPKALARLYRFQQALASIDPARPAEWATIAHAACYYDQAHFNKDFAAFTGLTPTEYLRLRRAVFGETLARGEDVHFVPIG